MFTWSSEALTHEQCLTLLLTQGPSRIRLNMDMDQDQDQDQNRVWHVFQLLTVTDVINMELLFCKIHFGDESLLSVHFLSVSTTLRLFSTFSDLTTRWWNHLTCTINQLRRRVHHLSVTFSFNVKKFPFKLKAIQIKSILFFSFIKISRIK